MSKRTTTICDRCGRFGEMGFSHMAVGWTLEKYNLTARASIDICNKCRDAVDAWLNDAKAKEVKKTA